MTETGAGPLQLAAQVGPHSLIVDEPAAAGGGGTGPDPYDYLAVALAGCTALTLRIYARLKGLELGRISVTVDHAKVHADDCRDCGEGRVGKIDRFERVIAVPDALDAATPGAPPRDRRPLPGAPHPARRHRGGDEAGGGADPIDERATIDRRTN